MRKIIINIMVLCIIFVIGCKKTPMDDGNPPSGGHEPLPLPKYFDYPAWHPDGKWIATEHSDSIDTNKDKKYDEKFGGIWLVNAITGEKQPLIKGCGLPGWSPDGKKLAIVKDAQIFTVEVNILEPASIDTNSFIQLTTEGSNFFPTWSPDGKWIAYDSNAESLNGMYFIWIMKVDGSQKRRVAYEPEIGEIRMPSWSKNGKEIVHQRYLGVNAPEIVIMDTLAINILRLTFDDRGDWHPKYSPLNSEIAFYSQPRIGPPAIWLINSDGSNSKKISPDYAWRFDWSPDGKKIVFLYWDFLTERPGNGQLWIMNVDGTDLHQLTYFSK